MTKRIWVQYHNTENMGRPPSGGSIWTSRRPRDVEGDIIFLIEGSGKPRRFQLWSRHVAGKVERLDNAYTIHAKREWDVREPLGGDDFDSFKKRMQNFRIGFHNITTEPYASTLEELARRHMPRLRHPLVDGYAPEWASGWGQDEYGIFAEFSLPGDAADVIQRMRWIPPGQFQMGSPENEPGRDPDETQHEVTISKALWFFDTLCTQSLWQAVMGGNPSHFVDPHRPVENVSWEDGQEFIEKLNSAICGLALRLPTEGEWEYACRAGTTDATYAGPLEILGANNAPVLDPIAWYGGNSGKDFDLEDGWDSSSWPKKQFDHQKAGTRKVGEKLPNRWGLFDMLGNVWEWCQDWYTADFDETGAADRTGPSEGHRRVLRGGCWLFNALLVRSAYRVHLDPGVRNGSIGFRCAQVQEM